MILLKGIDGDLNGVLKTSSLATGLASGGTSWRVNRRPPTTSTSGRLGQPPISTAMTRWISVTVSTASPLDVRPHVRSPALPLVTQSVATEVLGPPLVLWSIPNGVRLFLRRLSNDRMAFYILE